MARWRAKIWFADRPDVILQWHRNIPCKLCAIHMIQLRAAGIEKETKRAAGTAKWSLERIRGHLQGWEIVFHSDQRIGNLPARHGH